MNEDPLVALSRRTAEIVSQSSAQIVRVESRRRAPASGVSWSADLVVTAHHCVERADDGESLEVGRADGSSAEAVLLGRDPSTDLAVLRVKGSGLVASTLSDPVCDVATGELLPGHLLVGISRPGRTVRAALGVVARVAGEWRGPAGGHVDRFIESSLELEPGLSGALAVSASGQALGLITAGLLRGTAIVIPAATLRRVVTSLERHGRVRRGYLGVATFPVRLPAPLATAAGQDGALLVSGVEPESPAAKAGLILGDVLLSVGGTGVSEYGDLVPLLEEERVGQEIAVKILRAGGPREISVVVGVRERRAS